MLIDDAGFCPSPLRAPRGRGRKARGSGGLDELDDVVVELLAGGGVVVEHVAGGEIFADDVWAQGGGEVHVVDGVVGGEVRGGEVHVAGGEEDF
jgi:hypothetical protein